jgi:pyridoxine 4-dehydrogenase
MIKKTAPYHASQAGTFLLGGKTPINRLGFGAMRLTGPNIWGPSKKPEEARKVLKRVIELGVNFIDTADSYGPEISENFIAEVLYPYPSDLIIATKGGLLRPDPSRWVPLGRPDYLMQCVEMSLRRLRLERIDLYQLHAIDPKVPLEESLGALKEMQKQGKIRYIGLSNFTVSEVERAKKVVDVVSIQNEYNVTNRKSESVVSYCEKQQLAFIPWFPIGSGELAQRESILQKIAALKGATPAQIALSWLLKKAQVMVPIPGTSSLEHLEDNIAAVSIDFTDSELNQLEKQTF